MWKVGNVVRRSEDAVQAGRDQKEGVRMNRHRLRAFGVPLLDNHGWLAAGAVAVTLSKSTWPLRTG